MSAVDHNRIQLSEWPGVPGSDYINASYIKGASGSNAYIACQGPLPHTVNDFWRLVVETEVQVIVMACNEQEGGKHKCERYWSEETDAECQYGKYFVRLLKSREICPDFLGTVSNPVFVKVVLISEGIFSNCSIPRKNV